MNITLKIFAVCIVIIVVLLAMVVSLDRYRESAIDKDLGTPEQLDIEMERIVDSVIAYHCAYRLRTDARLRNNTNRSLRCARLWLMYEERKARLAKEASDF